jgi:hypothetical protein
MPPLRILFRVRSFGLILSVLIWLFQPMEAPAQVNPLPISWRYQGYVESSEWWLEHETLPGWNYLVEESQDLATWVPMAGGFTYGDGGLKRHFITQGPVPVESGEPPPPPTAPVSKEFRHIQWEVTLSADAHASTIHLKRLPMPGFPAWDTVLDLPLPRLVAPETSRRCYLLSYEDESHDIWCEPSVKMPTAAQPQPADTLPSAGAQEEFELAVFQSTVNQLTAYLSYPLAPAQPDNTPRPHKFVRIRRSAADSNHNGIPDWQEMQYGFPVFTAGIDPNGDEDGDGRTNAQEFAAGTDPRTADPAAVNLYSAWHQASLHRCVFTNSPPSIINSETASNGLSPSYVGSGPGTVTAAGLNGELDAIWGRAPAAVAGNAPFAPVDVPTSSLIAYVTGQYSSSSPSNAVSSYGSSFASLIDGATIRYRFQLHSLRPPPVLVERNFLTILRKQPNGWTMGNTSPPAGGWSYYQEALVTRSLQPAASTSPMTSPDANIFRPAIDEIPDGKQMRNERTLAEISLRADTSRNGTIGPDDYHTHQPAVYTVNYNHDQGRTEGSMPVEDAVKWVNVTQGNARYSDGEPQTQIEAKYEDWKLDLPQPENPAHLAPLRIAPIAFAKLDMKVVLRLPAPGSTTDPVAQKYKAFHLYIVKSESGGTKTYIPIWGGITSTGKPSTVTLGSEVDISQYINPQAAGYMDSRSPASPGTPPPPYEFLLEGLLFKGMPYPDASGLAAYGPTGSTTHPVFDGILRIGLEFRDGASPTPIGGKTSWATLTCAPSLPLDATGNPQPAPIADLIAFKGNTPETTAQGYGKHAIGGRYGHVYTVTNNSDNANDYGSLRYAINSAVPRTIVFALPEGMDGNIALTSDLRIKDRQCTIAGQTAFRNGSDGICLKDRRFIIDTDDLIVRHLRARPGPAAGTNADAFCVDGVSTNVILDHCTGSFSNDCLLDVTTGKIDNTNYYLRANRAVTAQNCLLAWPLNRNVHVENGELQDHGYGSLVRGGNGAKVTLWRNFYGHFLSRCPRPSGTRTPLDDTANLRLDFINNVAYGWGDEGLTPSIESKGYIAGYDDGDADVGNPTGRYNLANNYYRGRLNYAAGTKRWFRTSNPNAHVWMSGNRIKIPPMPEPETPVDQYDGNLWVKYGVNKNGTQVTEAMLKTGVPPAGYAAGALAPPMLEAMLAQQKVIAKAGASLKRDALDLRLLGPDGLSGEYENRTGTMINSPNNLTGPGLLDGWSILKTKTPPPDADSDGIPDEREPVTAGRSPAWTQDPRNAAMDDDKNGLTNLEEYLNSIAQ